MQTVSAEIEAIQQGTHFEYYRRVWLSRREWNSLTDEYDYVDYIDISDYVIKAGDLAMNLDLIVGTWDIGSLDITLRNNDGKFSKQHSGSYWDGYNPEKSKVRIEFGYNDDGTERGLYIFTGVLDKNGLNQNDRNKTAQLHVRGKFSLLEGFACEDMPDLFHDNDPMVNSGDNKTYTTAENGIGKILRVYSNAVLKTVNDDYSITDLNIHGSPGSITFGIDQGANAITADYVEWYKDQSFKYLIEKLLDYAGETGYSVQETTFPNNVRSEQKYDIKAEWDAGTIDKVYTSIGDDKLYMGMVYYMVSGSSSSAGIWDPAIEAESKIAQSFQLKVTTDSVSVGFAPIGTGTTGATVSIKADNGGDPTGAVQCSESVSILGSNDYQVVTFSSPATLTAGVTYWLVIEWTSGVSPMRFHKSSSGNYTDGVCKVYVVLGASWNLTAYDLCFHIKDDTGECNWMSTTIDCTAAVAAWGTVTDNKSNAGTMTYYTLSKAADAGWPVAFDPNDWDLVIGGVIASAVLRYIRVAVVIDFSFATGARNPYYYPNSIPNLIDLTVEYFTSKFEITLSDWSDYTVRDALDEMVGISGYIHGFYGDGNYFYKSRNPGTSSDKRIFGIQNVDDLKKDFTRIYNRVNAQFGDYSAQVDSFTQGDARPNSIDDNDVYVLPLSFTQILANDDVDVAQGSAETYYSLFNVLQWFSKISGQIYPQIELDDIITLGYTSDSSVINIYNGYLYNGYKYGSHSLPYDILMRVVGIVFKLNDFKKGGMELKLLGVANA